MPSMLDIPRINVYKNESLDEKLEPIKFQFIVIFVVPKRIVKGVMTAIGSIN